MLPPKPEHEALLAELEAAAKRSKFIRGYLVHPHQAKSVLTLYETMTDPILRDRLLSKTVSDMIAVTIRVQGISDSYQQRRRALG